MNTKKVLNSLLSKAHDPCGSMMFYPVFCHVMPVKDAVVFCDLLDLSRNLPALIRTMDLPKAHQLVTDDGWFRYSTLAMQKSLGIKPGMQKTILNRLRSMGLISVKQQGRPTSRWLLVHEDASRQLLAEARLKRAKRYKIPSNDR